MFTLASKRRRTEPQNDMILAPVPSQTIAKAISRLDRSTIAGLLFIAANENPRLAQKIVEEQCSEQIEKVRLEQATVKKFDHFHKAVWMELRIALWSRSRQSESSLSVIACAKRSINGVKEGVISCSSFETKRRAIETLRKIGQSICLNEDLLSCKEQTLFQVDTCLEKTMRYVVKCMTMDERVRMGTFNGGRFLDELDDLIYSSDDLGFFEGLGNVRRRLTNIGKDPVIEGNVEDQDHDEDDLGAGEDGENGESDEELESEGTDGDDDGELE